MKKVEFFERFYYLKEENENGTVLIDCLTSKEIIVKNHLKGFIYE